MVRTTLPALLAAFVLLPAAPLAAEEAAAPSISTVAGVSAGDLLNLRASASPVGIVMDRLPNGTMLTNFGCSDVHGYTWCKVAEVQKPELNGWVPARYLDSDDTGDDSREAAAPVAGNGRPVQATSAEASGAAAKGSGAEAAQSAAAPAADMAEADPQKTGGVVSQAPATPANPPVANATQRDWTQPELPADLMARLGGDANQLLALATEPQPPAAGKGAAAYGLGYAAGHGPVASKVYSPLPADGAGDDDDALEAPIAAGIPIPTPRPDPSGVSAAEPAAAETPSSVAPAPAVTQTAEKNPVAAAATQPAPLEVAEAVMPSGTSVTDASAATSAGTTRILSIPEIDPGLAVPTASVVEKPTAEPSLEERTVAQVETLPVASKTSSVPPAYDATGEIPCARYIGQPMTRCEAGVVHKGDDAAEVTVTWPDGGTRIIRFRAGKPEGSNSRGEFRSTNEGGLNLIRIGAAERLEITDALAFGG